SVCGFGLLACSGGTNMPDMGKPMDMVRPVDMVPPGPKGVYTLSNDVNDNQLFVFSRAADGTLTPKTPVSTGGRGTGVSLSDQGALAFDPMLNRFFAVNAGDNSVSMLALNMDGSVTLLFKALTGGVKPVSVTEYGGNVYVVNAGDNFTNSNISGFQIT